MSHRSLSDNLRACHECDLLQTDVRLAPGEKSLCIRCGAELDRRPHANIEHVLAYCIAAVICLCLANIFPILSLEAQGLHSQATLIQAAQAMYQQDMVIVSILVLGTALVAPSFMLIAILYLLVPLNFGKIPPGFSSLFRLLQWSSPWTMIEVLMLGILVSLVKLSSLATAHVGIGLWAFAATMVLMALIAGNTSEQDLWLQYEKILARKNAVQLEKMTPDKVQTEGVSL